MSSVTCQISISLDGFVAGPNQSLQNPIGEGGLRLHEWFFQTRTWHAMQGESGGVDNSDSKVAASLFTNVGAYIMGRNMFSPGRGAWDLSWTGWWGDDPPYHTPVFVLTHYPRDPVMMKGGTTFYFVTDGVQSALDKARRAAGDKHVHIAGGASAIQQFLQAGLLDELFLHIAPVILGSGERLLENVGDPKLEPIEVVASPAVTHVRYRVLR